MSASAPIVVTDPTELAKAARFVRELGNLEERFGYRLGLGHDTDAGTIELVTFGDDDRFGVVRIDSSGAQADYDVPGEVGLVLVPAS